MAGGYLYDHFLGDSDYTAREAVVDAAGGAVGGSLFKPVVKGTGALVRGGWRFSRGGGALSSVTGREAVEVAGYTYGGRLISHSPKISRGLATGIGVGYAYDYFSQSPGSSSSSYQQSGGPGGTKKINQTRQKYMIRHNLYYPTSGRCGPGYELRYSKVMGAHMCFPKSRKGQKR